MATTTPHVFRRYLTYRGPSHESVLFLEDPEWWEWLEREETSIFRFTGFQGHFTARRENKHGKWYWYAYRKACGSLVKAYLGKSEELTEQRLESVAQTITERCSALRDLPSNEAHPPKPTPPHSVVSRRESRLERLLPPSPPKSDGRAPEEHTQRCFHTAFSGRE